MLQSTARRLETVRPSEVRQIHDLYERMKRQDGDQRFITLHFGESDLGSPEFIVEAGCQALRNGAVFYEANSGRMDLREQLVEYCHQVHVQCLSADHFVVSCGAMQAIHLALVALLDSGDTVLNITPAWPNFSEAVRLVGATVRELPLSFDARCQSFYLDFDLLDQFLAQVPRLRMVIVNTPSNPTGWVMSTSERIELLKRCRKHGAYLLADEIYDRIVFEDQSPPSMMSLAGEHDRLIVINGFSKTYCMTGWRVGYLIAEPSLARRLAQVQEFVTSHAPSAAQVAAITALRQGESFIEQSRHRYRHLRDLILSRLERIPGVDFARPKGAFYLFLKLPDGTDSSAFCQQFLRQCHVALAPGTAFGTGGAGWCRLCFATEPNSLNEAMDRLEGFLAS